MRRPWQPLLDKVLGEPFALFQGAVISEPGAAPQQPHMDGGHLSLSVGWSVRTSTHIMVRSSYVS